MGNYNKWNRDDFRKEIHMTYKTGNFAFYKGNKILIFDRQQSKIGMIASIYDVTSEESTITFVRESNLQPYKRKPNGQPSSTLMTKKQAKVIKLIEENLQVNFNGKTIEDVSIFIDMFLEESKQQYQLEKRIRESKYDGLNGFDLFHR